MAEFTLADFLQGRSPPTDDRAMWWSTPPYAAHTSEFTTPGDLRRQRRSEAPSYAFETDNPVINFFRSMNRGELPAQQYIAATPWLRGGLDALFQASMGMRSPAGARIGNQHAWAGRTPSAIVDEWPAYYYPDLLRSNIGMGPEAFTSEIGVRPPGWSVSRIAPWVENDNLLGRPFPPPRPRNFRVVPGGRND